MINDTLIRQYLVEYNKENKVFDMNDMQLWELDHLSLSYKNIIEIDNLLGLNKLQTLQLDNNIICRIQNLDKLVNLQWLDLSFNLISRIEGLDKLPKLTDLSLYNNKIEEISGLEMLDNLNVLSIGKNLLSKHEDAISYLQKLSNNLEVLKMAENPFRGPNGIGNNSDYKLYAIEMLKGLKYLDYQLISVDLREMARSKYTDDAAKEAESNPVNDDSNKQIDPELVAAKIDPTHKLLAKIQENSEDAQKLKIITKYADYWSNFDQEVDAITQKFQIEVKAIYKEK